MISTPPTDATSAVALPPNTKITPMLRQWLDAKQKAPGAVLLFRMGDFYELFGEDATTAGPLIDLAVTTRDRDKGDGAMPMAGFPHHQAPQYIAKLIGAGMKVAVCDQMEDPALAKGIVKRELTRIITPGMVLDDESLQAGANNFLVAVAASNSDDNIGLCAMDASTGEVMATVLSLDALVDEVVRLAPRELVLARGAHESAAARIAELSSVRVELTDRPGDFALSERLGPADPWLSDGARKLARVAVETALSYAQRMGQGTLLPHLLPARGYGLGDTLIIDPTTARHLDLMGPAGHLRKEGTLLELIDRTSSAAGGRRLLQMLSRPSAHRSAIEQRLDRVSDLVTDTAMRVHLRAALKRMPDIDRLVARIAARRCSPRDLLRLKQALEACGDVVHGPSGAAHVLADVTARLQELQPLTTTLTAAVGDDAPAALGSEPAFRTGFDTTLDEVTKLSSGGRDAIASMQDRERQQTGITTLKIRYTRVFGYTIEVTKAQQHKAPKHFIRKQTIANGERFVTDELMRLQADVEGAEQRRLAREGELFETLMDDVTTHARALLFVSAAMAELDALASLAEVAVSERWVRPQLLDSDAATLDLVDARHPVVEAGARRRGESYVPSSVQVGGARQLLIITGPNMAGKSTMMRQVALAQILAQAGSFVPAAKASLSLCDRIFTRIGACDDLARGRSTFMVEMAETSQILRGATPRSLVLLDEIGRGTSTYDGLSIAWAVAEHIHDVTGCRTLFATHYHELTRLDETLARVHNVHMVVTEFNDEIVFVRTVSDGPAHRSYGIQVARLAGLPDTVLARAKQVLRTLEVARPPTHAAQSQLPNQPSLFDVTPAVVTRLRALDVMRMTPMDALTTLAALVDEATK